MHRIRITSLILSVCLFISLSAQEAFALSDPQPDAAAVVLADMNSGNILYEKNMNARRSPASLTKIMTGLLAVEALERGDFSLEDEITAPSDCWQGLDSDSSNADIYVGEKMSFKDYLYCALVKSANEACNVLAVAIDGSIQSFVNRMNTRAAELGAKDTYFSDTNGLSNENHYTTAYDLFLITSAAMSHPLFAEIVDTVTYEVPPTNKTDSPRVLHNSNALICDDSIYGKGYLYSGASGVKTGYTRAAGYCLVSTAERDGISLVAVVLGCGGWLNTGNEDYMNFSQTIKLYNWAFSNFEYRTLVSYGEAMQQVPVRYAEGGQNAILRATREVTELVPKDIADEDICIDVSIEYDALVAPITAGTKLGNAKVSVGEIVYANIPLTVAADIKMERKAYYREKLTEFFSEPWVRTVFIIIVAAVLLYLIILVRYKALRRRHLQEREEAEIRRREALERKRNLELSRQAQEEMRRFRQNNLADQTQRFTSVPVKQRPPEDGDIDELIRSLGFDKDDL